MSVYEPNTKNPASPQYVVEMEMKGLIHGFMKVMAEVLNTDLLWSEDVTRQSFGERLQQSRVLTFLGHYGPSTNRFKHPIRLFNEQIPLHEIFDIPIPSSFVFWNACGTALQRITLSDDSLGLTQATLFAGAASVMGNLWPVHPDAARQYTLAFFKKLRAQSDLHSQSRTLESMSDGHGGARFLSLAQAWRETVLEMRNGELKEEVLEDGFWETKTYHLPYQWASFCLYGSPVAQDFFQDPAHSQSRAR